ncbi:MAG: NTP transferase domain-containing protein [Clostridia bacterium]
MNAIILAAGMGTRLRPLTNAIPKALVKVGSESFFERQVRLLRNQGIADITVLTGYCAEAFRPWYDETDLLFVHNEHYHDWNNLYSMFLVRNRLADTLVLDGDVWIGDEVLPSCSPATSRWYVGHRTGMANEWVVVQDGSGRVRRIEVRGGEGWILTGISYWSAHDGPILAGVMEGMMARPDAPTLFWDDAPRNSLDDIEVRAQPLGSGAWVEVDTVDELQSLRQRVG